VDDDDIAEEEEEWCDADNGQRRRGDDDYGNNNDNFEDDDDDDRAASDSLRGASLTRSAGTGAASITSADLELTECPHHPHPYPHLSGFASTSRQASLAGSGVGSVSEGRGGEGGRFV
jgi:hypothetical protein